MERTSHPRGPEVVGCQFLRITSHALHAYLLPMCSGCFMDEPCASTGRQSPAKVTVVSVVPTPSTLPPPPPCKLTSNNRLMPSPGPMALYTSFHLLRIALGQCGQQTCAITSRWYTILASRSLWDPNSTAFTGAGPPAPLTWCPSSVHLTFLQLTDS